MYFAKRRVVDVSELFCLGGKGGTICGCVVEVEVLGCCCSFVLDVVPVVVVDVVDVTAGCLSVVVVVAVVVVAIVVAVEGIRGS